MFERFTDRARVAVTVAQETARGLGHPYVGTEHLLLALSEGEGIAAKALDQLGFDRARFERSLLDEVAGGPVPSGSSRLPFTPRLKKAIEAGLHEALALGHNYIGTEHLAIGLLRDESSLATKLLAEQDISEQGVREVVVRLLTELLAERVASQSAEAVGAALVEDLMDAAVAESSGVAVARCTSCREPLAANLGAELVPSVGEVERVFVISFCRSCGHTFAVLPDD